MPGNSLVLVTGASGFLGQHLVRFLSAKGCHVRALYYKNSPENDLLHLPGVTWMQCDLLDVFAVEAAMESVSEVYHCAAIVSFHPSQKERMLHFNVESTVNMVNEALERNIRKMIFVSSVAALGRGDEKKEITEEQQWEESKYNSHYGLSKQLSEIEVWRGIGEGLNAVIVNPGIILGEGNWEEGSARLMTVVYQEFPFYTHGINGWVDVKDVVNAMVQLMESEISAERFILSAGNFSYKDVFTEMAAATGKKAPHIPAGRLLTNIVWRWSMIRSKWTGKTATITRETASTAQKKVFYNNQKLLKTLPFFRYTDLKTTVQRMAAAYLKDKR